MYKDASDSEIDSPPPPPLHIETKLVKAQVSKETSPAKDVMSTDEDALLPTIKQQLDSFKIAFAACAAFEDDYRPFGEFEPFLVHSSYLKSVMKDLDSVSLEHLTSTSKRLSHPNANFGKNS